MNYMLLHRGADTGPRMGLGQRWGYLGSDEQYLDAQWWISVDVPSANALRPAVGRRRCDTMYIQQYDTAANAGTMVKWVPQR